METIVTIVILIVVVVGMGSAFYQERWFWQMTGEKPKLKRKIEDLIDEHIGQLRCAGAVFDKEREIEYVKRKHGYHPPVLYEDEAERIRTLAEYKEQYKDSR